MTLREYKTQESISVPFIWGTKDFGRAEFQLCAEHERNKIVGFYVYHLQQENIKYYWHYSNLLYNGLGIHSYQELTAPEVWMTQWCKEHKSLLLELYVPPKSKFINLDHNGIGFTKTPWYKIPEVLTQ